MNRVRPDTFATRIKTVALLVVLLGVVGFLTDMFEGFPLTRESKSWVAFWMASAALVAVHR